jgi:hypothetical protein
LKYQIPIIVEVEALDIDDARQIVYGALLQEKLPEGSYAEIADDSNTLKDKSRVVVLHPEEMSIEEYYTGEKEC